MKISFLVHSLYNIGGTIKTTLNTAEALADLGHEVEIATVFRRREEPLFSVDPRIKVVVLVDTRKTAPALTGADARLAAKPSRLFPKTEPRHPQYSRYADERIIEYLRGCDADVIVGTRPGLNIAIAAHAPAGLVKIGQEHLFLDRHGRRLERKLYRAYRGLDAVTTVSSTDADSYRKRMPRIAANVHFIPNSIPATSLPPSDVTARTIIAAGRIEKIKRYDLLIDAFAMVHTEHPEWTLRIYGHGRETKTLRTLVEGRGLHDSVQLMGTYTPIDAEWVKGSIAAVTSEIESFGLTIVEAMGCGLPVVSTACPYGPPEIIDSGVTGLLTPPGDVEAFAKALRGLIENEEQRRTMGAAAREHAKRYTPARIGAEYAALFESRLSARERTDTGPALDAASRATSPDSALDCHSVDMSTLRLAGPADRLSLAQAETTVTPTGADGAAVVNLDDLDEGVWTVLRDGAPVTAGRVDSRALTRAGARADATGIVVPYAEPGTGALLVRVWRRDWFAEVTSVSWHEARLRVTGRLLGPGLPKGTATGTATLRTDPSRVHALTTTTDDDGFSVEVDTDALTLADGGGAGLWDLRLSFDPESAGNRVGKVFDDVALRKNTHRFPERVGVGTGRALRVKPYFAIDNQLSIKVTEAE